MFARISLTTAINDSRISSRRTRGFISDIFRGGARKPITTAARRQTPRPDSFRTRRSDDPLTDEPDEILPGKRPPHVTRPRRKPHAVPRTSVPHPGHRAGNSFPSPGSGPHRGPGPQPAPRSPRTAPPAGYHDGRRALAPRTWIRSLARPPPPGIGGPDLAHTGFRVRGFRGTCEVWRISALRYPLPVSRGSCVGSSGNREKSRSRVSSASTPCATHTAAMRAS